MSNKKPFKLKTIGKITPEQYIIPVYSILLLIVFILLTNFILFITKKDYYTITSFPDNAAVYVEDKLLGYTPLITKKVNKNSVVYIKKHAFETEKIVINREKNINITLRGYNGLDFLKEAYKEASNWSLIKSSDVDSRFPIPLLFSEPVKSYFYMHDFNEDVLNEYLISSLKQLTNKYLLSDYIRALAIKESENKILSVSSIVESARFINRINSNYRDISLLVTNKLLESNKNLYNSELYKEISNRHGEVLNKYVIKFDEPRNDIKFNDLTFKNIPEATLIPVDVNFIHIIEQDNFYIADSLISRDSYLKFTKEVPFWNIENKDELIKLNFVDNNYLENINNEDYITNISYYSAVAWCEWANTSLNIPSGYKLALPSGNMWHSAVQFKAFNILGSWQWTNNGFYLYDHFLTTTKGEFISEFASDIMPRVVVGENKYNYKVESGRGVQSANWCTPYTSIRPVLIKEK